MWRSESCRASVRCNEPTMRARRLCAACSTLKTPLGGARAVPVVLDTAAIRRAEHGDGIGLVCAAKPRAEAAEPEAG